MKKNSIQNMMIIGILIKKKKTNYMNKKLNMLPIHKVLSKLNPIKTQIDYDANSLYVG